MDGSTLEYSGKIGTAAAVGCAVGSVKPEDSLFDADVCTRAYLSTFLIEPDATTGTVFLFRLIQHLVSWRWRWEVKYGAPLQTSLSVNALELDGIHSTSGSWFENDIGIPSLHSSLNFDDVARAQEFSLYHTLMAFLLRLLEEQQHPNVPPSLSSPTHFELPAELYPHLDILDGPTVFPRVSQNSSKLT